MNFIGDTKGKLTCKQTYDREKENHNDIQELDKTAIPHSKSQARRYIKITII